MVSYVEIKGFDDFAKYTENIDQKGPPVFFFFSGSKLPSGGSWCPDCVEGTLLFTSVDLRATITIRSKIYLI